MSWWTTEQVAEYLQVTPQSVYDSRARQKFPGRLGRQRGRRLMFPSEAIEAGRRAVEEGRDPDTPETTDDATQAILWALSGIHTTLRSIDNRMRALRYQPGDKPLVLMHPGDYSGVYFGLTDDEVHITGNTINTEEEE